MSDERLQGKTAVVVGGGQTPGLTMGNGRATAVRFAAAGARVLVADRDVASAQSTVDAIGGTGGEAEAVFVDVVDERSVREMIGHCLREFGAIDVLHNNVGVSLAAGDAEITDIDLQAFSHIVDINLRGMVATCKHVLPVMRRQRGGAIVNVGSIASLIDYPNIAYKTSKAGVVAMTQSIAIRNAEYGIRANAILPGLIDTPMAIEPRIGSDKTSREDIVEQRNAQVPLGRRMGTSLDVANAALFLASDEAAFVTGAVLPVDGGHSIAIGR